MLGFTASLLFTSVIRSNVDSDSFRMRPMGGITHSCFSSGLLLAFSSLKSFFLFSRDSYVHKEREREREITIETGVPGSRDSTPPLPMSPCEHLAQGSCMSTFAAATTSSRTWLKKKNAGAGTL